MEKSHLEYLFSIISHDDKNTYDSSINTVMGNWIRVAKELGIDGGVTKDEKGRNHLTLVRDDGSYLGTVEPAMLPRCAPAARVAARSKILTTKLLSEAGVRVPRSKIFEKNQRQEARQWAFETGADLVVVKAHSMSQGKGVNLEVTKNSFDSIFDQCISVQEKRGYAPRVIVQEMIDGFDVRCVIIEGRFHSAISRISAFVRGDGTSTVQQLIDAKNAQRAQDSFFKKKLIVIDSNAKSHLKRSGVSLTDVPAEGEFIPLTSMANSTYGGDSVNVTDLLSDNVKEEARKAIAAIPGTCTAGVDLLIDRFDTDNPLVIEINSFPFMHIGRYPTYGEPVDPQMAYMKALIVLDKLENADSPEFTGEELGIIRDYVAFLELRDKLEQVRSIPKPKDGKVGA